MRLALDRPSPARRLYRRLYWLPTDARTAWRYRGVRLVVHFHEDSLGDDLLCSAVLRELHERGERGVCLMTGHPELFAHAPFISRIEAIDWPHLHSLRRIGIRVIQPVYTHLAADGDHDSPPRHHIIDEMCRCVGLSGAIALRPWFFLTDTERAGGRRRPRQVAIQTSGAGGRNYMRNKDWFLDRFQAVVDGLADTCDFVQLGSPKDPLLKGVLDLRGRTNLRESAAILSQSRFFVGLVGFAMHLARAVECRSVIVFGGREHPDQAGYPCNENLYTAVPCAPCWQRNRCDYEHECMRRIVPDDVIAAVKRLELRLGAPLECATAIIPSDPLESSAPR